MSGALRRSTYMRLTAIAVLATALVFAGCGASEDAPNQSTEESQKPWGMTFVSTEMTRGGDPVDLIGDADLEVRFQEAIDRPNLSDTPQGIAWRASCNYMGGRADISGSKLIIGPVTSTDMGCPPPRHREDKWLSDFFAGDPSLELEGARLTLRNGETVIRLARSPR